MIITAELSKESRQFSHLELTSKFQRKSKRLNEPASLYRHTEHTFGGWTPGLSPPGQFQEELECHCTYISFIKKIPQSIYDTQSLLPPCDIYPPSKGAEYYYSGMMEARGQPQDSSATVPPLSELGVLNLFSYLSAPTLRIFCLFRICAFAAFLLDYSNYNRSFLQQITCISSCFTILFPYSGRPGPLDSPRIMGCRPFEAYRIPSSVCFTTRSRNTTAY